MRSEMNSVDRGCARGRVWTGRGQKRGLMLGVPMLSMLRALKDGPPMISVSREIQEYLPSFDDWQRESETTTDERGQNQGSTGGWVDPASLRGRESGPGLRGRSADVRPTCQIPLCRHPGPPVPVRRDASVIRRTGGDSDVTRLFRSSCGQTRGDDWRSGFPV